VIALNLLGQTNSVPHMILKQLPWEERQRKTAVANAGEPTIPREDRMSPFIPPRRVQAING
jgi:hypothetical protein